MILLIVAYVGGVLTILSPCILPVLPFVFARADRPFLAHGLPMLAGMALAFTAVATLAAVGGGWVVALNQYGRWAALALLAGSGLALWWPRLAERLARPLVAAGARLSASPGLFVAMPALAPVVLGIGTGLLWAPCAGPILGLILTGAALNGASLGTSVLLLAYAVGACSSLALALLFGGRVARGLRRGLHASEWLRRGAGAAVLAGVAAIALGLDTGLLSRLSSGTPSHLEAALVKHLDPTPIPASTPAPMGPPARAALPVEGLLPALDGATGWLNSAPLSPQALRGKVVLVDFWTYSCINCLRTLPWLRAWADKYRDAGLVVLGVHTPEFAFEKQPANVQRAVGELKLGYPIALDSDFAIWRAFDNHYWPAFYLVDAQGRIRHHQFGEGDYDRAEQAIRQLLAEAHAGPVPAGLVAPRGEGTQAAPGLQPPRTPETYLGYGQGSGLASPGGAAGDRAQDYALPASLPRHQWALAGTWNVERERVVLARAGGRIALRFQARDLHLVLGPAADGRPVRFRVRIDGQAPLADHGADVDAQGRGVVEAQKLYQLVRRASGSGEAVFEIEFLDPGAQAYAFTFG